MSDKVRVISARLQVEGLQQFYRDLDAGAERARRFGSELNKGTKSGGDALDELRERFKLLSGESEQFAARALPLFKMAFPTLLVAEFGGLILELPSKIAAFMREVNTAGGKASSAFRDVLEPLRLTNDELALANAHLERDIAKLEGKPQNNLKVALEESMVAAEKLATSLEKDLDRIKKVLEEQKVGTLRQLLGESGTETLSIDMFGGNGFGGFQKRIEGINDRGNERIRSAKTGEASQAATDDLYADLLKAYDEQIKRYRTFLAALSRTQSLAGIRDLQGNLVNEGTDKDVLSRSTRGMIADFELERSHVSEQAKNTKLEGRKQELTDSDQASRAGRPFDDRMATLQSQLDGLRAKSAAIGQPASVQEALAGYEEARKAILEVSEAYAKQHQQLSDDERVKLRNIGYTKAAVAAENEWKSKFENTTAAIEQRIAAQRSLADAIGKGFEATRAASINTKVVQELGPKAFDKDWMASHQPDVENLRAKVEAQDDSEQAVQSAKAVDALKKQIQLENELAGVISEGAAAVERATFSYRLRQLAAADATEEQIQKEIELHNLQRANARATNIAVIDQQSAAVRRLSDAVLGGADAERRAALESKYGQMRDGGATEEAIGKQSDLDAKDHQLEVTQQALKTGMAYTDQLRSLDEQIKVLKALREGHEGIFEIEVSLRDLENQRLDVLAQATLKLGTARDGIRAFFIEMQKDAKSAAQTVYDALNSALSQTSQNLARLATGQRTNFGGMLQGIGQEMVQSQVQGAMQKGIGLLGKATGLDLSTFSSAVGGKPDGTSADRAFWVRMAGTGGGGGGQSAIDPASWLGKILGVGTTTKTPSSGKGKTFGAGDLGSGVFSFAQSLFSGFRADGGGVDPGRAYVVGERGPELFMPSTGGSVVPNGANWGGAPVVHIHNNVDARGSDLGVEGRIERGLQMTHNAAVMNSVRAQREHQARTPRR